MKMYKMKLLLCLLVVGLVSVSVMAKKKSADKKAGFLLDDFGKRAGAAQRKWEFIADTVMGGKSSGKVEFVSEDGRECMLMSGDVSLENNGGFIQCRTILKDGGKPFDASGFDGVTLTVKGNGKKYAVHLRTSSTWLPWQYYEAKFETGGEWQTITLPFKDFKPYSLKKPLKQNKIKSIAIVAIGEAMKAEIYVDEVKMQGKGVNYKELTEEEKYIILEKGTERPFTGKFNDHYEKGVYTCRQCGARLYESSSKFKSSCGWPSFDDEVVGAVRRQIDADGRRTEIVCANCGGHLGHVFLGEGYTAKNTRHCVNSISMDFIPEGNDKMEKLETAIFASGCFWGVQYYFSKEDGVKTTKAGYTGGHVENPTYKQVCTGETGHAEAVEVVFDPAKTSYEDLAKLYFETHDFTQLNRQGPDVGTQYRSEIFYTNDAQRQVAEKLIEVLAAKGYDVKTKVTKAGEFYEAEDYHQDYFDKKSQAPTCHIHKKIF